MCGGVPNADTFSIAVPGSFNLQKHNFCLMLLLLLYTYACNVQHHHTFYLKQTLLDCWEYG